MVRFIIVFVLVVLPCTAFLQREPSSLYFGIPIIDSSKTIQRFDEKIVGDYRTDENSYNRMVIEKDSIYVKVGTPLLFSVKEANQKGFTIVDDKIYGIDKNRGLFCSVEKDTVFTVYYQYETFYSAHRGDVMTILENKYLLSIKERNGLYTYLLLERQEDILFIKSIDHETQIHLVYGFSQIYSQFLEGINTYVVKPGWNEILKFVDSNGFNERISYQIIN
jgi:hypothetical protein